MGLAWQQGPLSTVAVGRFLALAARSADAVFTPCDDIAAGVGFRQNLRAQAAAFRRDPDQVPVLPGLSFLLAGGVR
jgi:alkanesulfonate monooxygenase SsuD/methylene tetrahydromethanopterin reductase-like flavin-dependent oxidoreductase (luciferase family)